MAWERNGLFPTITDTAEMTDCTPFYNGTVQWADFRITHSHYAIAKLLQLVQTQKELVIHKIHRRYYKTLPKKNPNFLETTRVVLNSTQTSKKRRQQLRKQDFSITNIFKKYKITDLTKTQ
jgi:hypothetical protein